jgi:DNA mismatch endonuclease (patch repair protein)
MRANRRRDSRAELAARSALHRSGLRFFVDRPLKLPGRTVRPDVVFPRARVAVFIDGCFWHACPEHGTQPRRNEQYWAPKLRRNVERDRAVDASLADAGWQVARFWEHQPVDEIVDQVAGIVAARRTARPQPE